MKKRSILFSGILMLGFVLFQPSFAAEWQPLSEITDVEIDIIENAAKKPAARILKEAKVFKIARGVVVLRFKNGDKGYYGYGSKKETTTVPERYSYGYPGDEPPAKPPSSFNAAGLNNEELLEALIKKFTSRLDEMRWNKNWTFQETDGIFSEIVGLSKTINWSAEEISYSLKEAFKELSHKAETKRYGIPLTALLSKLNTKYPNDEYLQDRFEWTVHYALLARDSPQEEIPTPLERRALAEELLQHYTSHPERSAYLGDARGIISLVAPDALAQFDALAASRK